MDADDTGTVDISELSAVLLSTGILNNQREVSTLFEVADADKSGGITFDEFLSVIDSYVKSKKIKIGKLDSVVKSGGILSKETLLSQERRGVLMKHVVDNSTLRARQLEFAFDGVPTRGRGARRRLVKQNSIGSVIRKNEIELDESSESIRHLCAIVRQSSIELGENTDPEYMPQKSHILPPVENVLSPQVLALVNQKHWKHYSISEQSDMEIREHLPEIEKRHQLYRSPSCINPHPKSRARKRKKITPKVLAPTQERRGSNGRMSIDDIRKSEILKRRRDSVMKT